MHKLDCNQFPPPSPGHWPAQQQTTMVPAKQAIAGIVTKSYKGSVKLPPLSSVPGMGGNELELKLSMTGVTFLRSNTPNTDPDTKSKIPVLDRENGGYKKRYTGGQCVVDCNGKLWLSKRQWEDQCRQEHINKQLWLQSLGHKIKNPPESAKTRGQVDRTVKTMQGKDNKKTEHTINKTEITNRLLVMTQALFAQVRGNSYLGMLTVSFPPAVSDQAAAQALNTWFTALREKERRVLKNYLWVAERQKIGTIHYHILITSRVNIVYVNRAMKIVLCNMVRDGIINYPLPAMKRYNGVDLAKDRKTRVVTNFCDPKSRKALTGYITKYVTKNNTTFPTAAWGCSRAFSALFTGITCTYSEFQKMQFSEYCYCEPVIKNLWFEFYPWLKETGPPTNFMGHLISVNGYILQALGFLN